MDLKEETILGERIHNHWYYVAKGRAMRDFLHGVKVPEVLDVGAGSGIFSKQLIQTGIAGGAVCVDPNYPEEFSQNFEGKSIRFVKSFAKTTQKLVIIMDVLEHVEDDLGLLKSYVDSMEPGSQVFITVPAFQFIWSSHDVFLEHYRRYTIRMVEDLVKKAGLTPVKSRYFFGSLFPLLALSRISRFIFSSPDKLNSRSDLTNYPPLINKLLIIIHEIERKTFFRFNRLFGVSVFCICRK